MKKSNKERNSDLSLPITTRRAAEHCQVSVPTLKRWIQKGDLASFRTPGGHHRIATAEFERFLRKEGLPRFEAVPAALPLLIVDDDPQFVQILAEVFGQPPGRFHIETATDGYEALIKVGAYRPVAIILDVVMPKLDGLEVCRRIRAMPETRDVKILGLTGYGDMASALRAAGADACLTKPVPVEVLAATLDSLLLTRASDT